jgi:hypothetical protein
MKRAWLTACLVAAELIMSPASAQMSLPGTFDVSETGAAVYTIRIAVPPGTAGLEPKLTLQYNSRSGNGLLGMGWSLGGLPAIVRCPKTIAQDGARGGINYDTNDRFCLEGERLVAISGTYGADGTEYRTEREGFSKIVSYGIAGTGPAWFKVWTKAGQILEFGNTADSRIEAQGKTTARLWTVNKVSDTAGNYLTVTYAEDNASGEYRPSRIDYTGNTGATVTPYASVRFVYETRPATDQTPLYEAGSLIKTTQRLIEIQTYTGESLVMRYTIGYETSASTRYSRVASLTLCDTVAVCLPATTFTWQNTAIAYTRAYHQTDSSGPFWRAGDGHEVMAADVNGDGRTDVIAIGHSYYGARVLLSNGDGTYSVAFQQMNDSQGPFWRAGDGHAVMAADVNGDGRTDVIAIGHSYYGARVLLSNGDGTYSVAFQQMNDSQGPFWRAGDGHAILVADVNGDGKADVIAIGHAYAGARVLLSKGDGTYSVAFQQMNDSQGPFWQAGANSTAYVADVNGDGRNDVIQVGNGTTKAQILLSNGDGTFRQEYYQPDASGPFWQAGAVNITMAPSVIGLGRSDIIQLGQDTYTAQVLLPTGVNPDLLASVANGFGAVTTVAYASLAQAAASYTKDTGSAACVYPCVDFQGPIYVVSQVETSNGVGGTYTSSYRFAGAKADQLGRGFLGFRQVTVKDEQTLVEQATEYLQTWPFTGLTSLRTKTRSSFELNRTENTHVFDDLGSGRRFMKLTGSVESSKELNGTLLPTVTTSYQYDAYGNATQIQVSTGDGHSKTTVNTYANDLANWFLGRLTRAEVISVTP